MKRRKVIYRTIHIERMKKFTVRKPHLESDSASPLGAPTSVSNDITQLLDRRVNVENEEWEYKFMPSSECSPEALC
jgi:hypothetical protein